jgi:hypothetical protein
LKNKMQIANAMLKSRFRRGQWTKIQRDVERRSDAMVQRFAISDRKVYLREEHARVAPYVASKGHAQSSRFSLTVPASFLPTS